MYKFVGVVAAKVAWRCRRRQTRRGAVAVLVVLMILALAAMAVAFMSGGGVHERLAERAAAAAVLASGGDCGWVVVVVLVVLVVHCVWGARALCACGAVGRLGERTGTKLRAGEQSRLVVMALHDCTCQQLPFPTGQTG